MKKFLNRILAAILCIAAVINLYASELIVLAEEPYENMERVGNTLVQFCVDKKTGRYTIQTEAGLPNKDTDSDSLLTFFKDEPETSFTTIKINGKDYIFGNDYGNKGGVIQETAVSGKIATTVWKVEGVEVTQTLKLITDMANPNVGNVQVSYKVRNDSGAEVQIGSRILLDIMLGANDASPFMANNETIVTETLLEGDKVPSVWQSADRKYAANVMSYGYLSGWDNIVPDKVMIAHWNTLSNTKWDSKLNEELDFTSDQNVYGSADSAIALYFEPQAFSNGEVKVFETYYGIGSIADAIYDTDDYTIQVQVPQKLSLNAEKDGYEQTPFDVNVVVTNNTDGLLTNMDVTLGLAAELAIAEGPPEKVRISEILPKDTYMVNFKVEPTLQEKTTVTEMGITVECGNSISEAQKYVILPAAKGEIPKVQLVDLAPNTLYTKTENKIIVAKGSGFELLKADKNWQIALGSQDGAERKEISQADVSIIDDSTMQIKLPTTKEYDYKVGTYQIYLTTGSYGNMQASFKTSDDKKYDQKQYGLLLIGGFDEDENGDVVYTVKALDTEEDKKKLSADEMEAVLLEIKGEIFSYEVDGHEVFNVGTGAMINNCITLKDSSGSTGAMRIVHYDEDYETTGDTVFVSMFSSQSWWGSVSDSLMISGEGRLYVGSYCFHTGDFYVCLEDGEDYELRGGELEDNNNNPDLNDDAANESDDSGSNEVEIITVANVITSGVTKAIGELTGFKINVTNAVLGEETVSLGGSLEICLPWYVENPNNDDSGDWSGAMVEPDPMIKDIYAKADQADGVFNPTSTDNENYLELDMSEMRYGLDSEDNTVDLVGVIASGGIALTPASIPAFVSGGANAGFEIDSINYPGWYIGMNGGFVVGDAFECELNFSLVKENSGQVYPDSFMFVAGGDKVCIPLGNVGYLTKLGGGVTGLYDTIKGNFNTFPPVTIHFITGYADPTKVGLQLGTVAAQVGGQGFSLSAEDGKVVGIDLIELIEAHLLLYGYQAENGEITNCIDIGGSMQLGMFDVIKGEASVWLVYDPRINGVFGNVSLGGKAYCGVFIPEWVPLVGGAELQSVMAELSTYRVYAGTRIIGIPISIAYYWADGEVKFMEDWSYVSENFNIPMEDLENALGIVYESGSANTDGVMLIGENMTKLPAVESAVGGLYEYEVNIANNDYTFIQAGYDVTALNGNESVLEHVQLLDPNGREVELVEQENVLLQHISADVSESGKDEDSISIGLVAPMNGKWTIKSDIELIINPYKVDELATVDAKDSVVGDGNVTVTVNAKNVDTDCTVDIYLVEETEETVDELSEEEIAKMSEEEQQNYYKEISAANPSGIKITDAPIAITTDADGNVDETISVVIPEHVQSGNYKVRAVINAKDEAGNDLALCSDVAEETHAYVNTNTPGNVSGVTMEPAGDGQFKISWDEVAEADGYFVQIVDKDGGYVEGMDGMFTEKLEEYMGGTYDVPIYATDENGEYVFDEDGNIVIESVKEVGIFPGQEYRALVYAYKEVNNTIYPSDTVVTEPIVLPVPMPATLQYKVNGVDVMLGTSASSDANYLQTDMFEALSGTTDVQVEVSSDQDVYLLVSVDGSYGDYTMYEIAAGSSVIIPEFLNEGTSILEFMAVNHQGDYTIDSINVEVDITPPNLMLDNLVVPSTAGKYQIVGTVEPNAVVYIKDEKIDVVDGKFTYNGETADSMEVVAITAVDRAGNEITMNCEIVASELTKLVELVVKQDGEIIDAEEDVLSTTVGQEISLELYGITSNGDEVQLECENASFTNLTNVECVDVVAGGVVTGTRVGETVLLVEYPLTETYSLEQTVAVNVMKNMLTPKNIILSNQTVDITATAGTVIARAYIPDLPAESEITFSISENPYMTMSGENVVVKDVSAFPGSVDLTITAKGTYVDNDGAEAAIDIAETFTFTGMKKAMSVVAPKSLNVLIGTAFEALNLPGMVEVELNTGEVITCSVDWTRGAYNANVADVYNIKGILNLPTDILNDDELAAYIQINVQKLDVYFVGEDKTVTYDGNAIDVSTLFTAGAEGGKKTYSIVNATGKAQLEGSYLIPTKAGSFEIKLETVETELYKAQSATATLTIQKGVQEKPVGLQVVGASGVGNADGKINGVSDAMEYSRDGGKTYIAIKGNEIGGLAAGTYYVRYAETDLYQASESVSCTVTESGKRAQSGLTLNIASEVTYGIGELEKTVIGGSGTGAISFSSSNPAVIEVVDGKLMVRGAGDAIITVAKAGDGTYNGSATSALVRVLPLTLELVWNGQESKIYDGEPSDVYAVALNVLEGDDCLLRIANNDAVDVGEYTAKIVSISNSNYAIPANNKFDYSITPKSVIVEWDYGELVYNAKSQLEQVVAAYKDVKRQEVRAAVSCEVDFVQAGVYQLKALIENDNYIIGEGGEQTVTIQPAVPKISLVGDRIDGIISDGVKLTATVEGFNKEELSGTVKFMVGEELLEEVELVDNQAEMTIKATENQDVIAIFVPDEKCTNYKDATSEIYSTGEAEVAVNSDEVVENDNHIVWLIVIIICILLLGGIFFLLFLKKKKKDDEEQAG